MPTEVNENQVQIANAIREEILDEIADLEEYARRGITLQDQWQKTSSMKYWNQ